MEPHEKGNADRGKVAGYVMAGLRTTWLAIMTVFVLFLLFCVIYTVKSAFGLDLFPNVHLKDIIDSILHLKG